MSEMTVMIVDDQDDFREILTTYLEEEGYFVMQAGDGAAALRDIRFRKPDLILLDIIMPNVDGYEVCRALKADPETADIPIVFLSAKTSLSDKLTGYVSGGQRFLCKPFDMDELEDCLGAMLNRDGPGGGARRVMA